MRKIIIILICFLINNYVFAQWTSTAFEGESARENVRFQNYYKLDLSKLNFQLKDAQETGKNAQPVVISLPTLDGKIEKFAVYSFPVIAKELTDQYQLGSYVGVGIDDPSKFVRFSTSPDDFQSMIIKDGIYEFIEPANRRKTVYGVHPKAAKSRKGFFCSTEEAKLSKQQLEKLYKRGKKFNHQPGDFSKSSDKKFRTLKLALSVTGEYTQYFGGTISGALTAINATLTTVNGIFEKDFALHLNLQNFPGIIYTNSATDPYSDATSGAAGAWNGELMNTLHTNVGEVNFDIGHLFGASGGGGNAGCIGCICSDDMTLEQLGSPIAYKGSGYTSPNDNVPQGDTFDIDFVAHEMGHQLGANHTYSIIIEGSGVNVEPGTGSTIMGYAGIGGILGFPNSDVQMHSDPYFHYASIRQVQANLISKDCDVETTISNNPPVITPFTNYTIPKGTAFVLTGSATDPEGDPMTYAWEQYDSASSSLITVTGNNATGALFRSLPPTTLPTRYFPKLSSVLAGNLTIPSDWESVPNTARGMKFAFTARDNHVIASEQQTRSDSLNVTVGDDGPFTINTSQVYHNITSPITWNTAGTQAAPYNVANVKIDYTTDNGATWTILATITPNDGMESFSFPLSLNGQSIKLRISAIGNIFYAIKPMTVMSAGNCDGSAPTGISISNITFTSALISWNMVQGATYKIRYKKSSETVWQQAISSANTIILNDLEGGTQYDVQISAVCGGNAGVFSSVIQFTTSNYCSLTALDSTDDYIANVTLANLNNTSGASIYTDYTSDTSKLVNLVSGSTNTVSVSKAWADIPYRDVVRVWIDFNRNGIFEENEMVMNSPKSITTPVSATFTIPTGAIKNRLLRMRVALCFFSPMEPCGSFYHGEVEDYNVIITNTLGIGDIATTENNIKIYPNPVTDILNVTHVKDNTTYTIYNAAGQLIVKGQIKDSKINVSGLIKGVYILSLENNKTPISFKFIKK